MPHTRSQNPPPIQEVLAMMKSIQKDISDLKDSLKELKEEITEIPTEIVTIQEEKKSWW